MTRISFTTRFFIKNRNNNDHLYVRIIVNRKSSDIDFKKDIKNHYFIESIPILVKHAKPSRLSGRGV